MKNHSLFINVWTCLCTVTQSLFLGLYDVYSYFTIFWPLQEGSCNCFYFSISKYRHWELCKSQDAPEGIHNSTEESNKLAILTFTTFLDKWLFRRWIQTTHFCIHFPTTIIKRNYIFLNSQLSGHGMANCTVCFIGKIWYILLK